MRKLIIPISLPFGIINTEHAASFMVGLNILRLAPEKNTSTLKFEVKMEPLMALDSQEIKHGGLILPKSTFPYFIAANESGSLLRQIVIDIEDAKTATDKDISLALGVFLLGILNIFGYARISPITIDDSEKILFNSRLTNLTQPGQDWFCLSHLLQLSMNKTLFNQVSSALSVPPPHDYEILNEHLRGRATPLDWSLIVEKSSQLNFKRVFSFGQVLSELIRQHPGIDYMSMIGILTAFIEGFLEVKGEHRYKFGIKLANLLKDNRIAPIAKKIYDSRSDFFHTGILKSPKSAFEFIRIEFLLLVIKEIFLYEMNSSISSDSFDFPL